MSRSAGACARRHRARGYAREAAIASLDLAFDRFGAGNVVGLTAMGHLPRQGLVKLFGMSSCEELDFIDRRFPADGDVNPQIVSSIT